MNYPFQPTVYTTALDSVTSVPTNYKPFALWL